MIYIDTNVWIYAITAHPKYGERCRELLERVERGQLKAMISAQVLSEVAGVLYYQFGVKDVTRHLTAIASYPLEIVDITTDIVIKAAEYAREYEILPYDGIHIASALSRMAKTILSADKELDKVTITERLDPLNFQFEQRASLR